MTRLEELLQDPAAHGDSLSAEQLAQWQEAALARHLAEMSHKGRQPSLTLRSLAFTVGALPCLVLLLSLILEQSPIAFALVLSFSAGIYIPPVRRTISAYLA